MWNKKTAAVVLAGLLVFAMLASGGCLGSSDSSSNNYDKAALIGKVSDEDRATLKEENIELVDYKPGQIKKTRSVVISNVESLTDAQTAEIKEVFAEDGAAVVTILDPEKTEDITAIKTAILGEERKDDAIVKENKLLVDKEGKKIENAEVRAYAIKKDDEGQTHSYGGIVYDTDAKFEALHRDDNIRQEDIDAGKVWVKYNNKTGKYDVLTYKLIPYKNQKGEVLYNNVEEKVLGQVAEGDVTVGSDKITVKFEGADRDCLSFEKEHELDLVCREGKELPAGEATRVDKISDGEDTPKTAELTDEEKMERANKDALKDVVEWTRKKELTKAEALVKVGYTKPKTRFERFMAWAKDILASNGMAFADTPTPQELFDIAQTYSGTLNSTYATLPGLSLAMNFNIASVHEFNGSDLDGGNDLYFVNEECVFTNDIESSIKRYWYQNCSYYSEIAEANNDSAKYYPNGAYCNEGYMGGYTVESTLSGGCPVVDCGWAKPETYNGVTTTTVTQGGNISGTGNVGVMATPRGPVPTAGLSLTAGYNCSKSNSYQTQDVSADKYDDSTSEAMLKWVHTVNKIPERGSPWTTLTPAADLAESTYNPMQTFVWRILTSNRSMYAADGLNVNVNAQVCGAYSHDSGSQKPQYYTMTVYLSGNIALPVPPRFCLDNDQLNFDNGSTAQYVAVYSQGDWSVDMSTVPAWIQISGVNTAQFTIQPQPNTTGEIRTENIKVYRNNGTDSCDTRTITVTQSM